MGLQLKKKLCTVVGLELYTLELGASVNEEDTCEKALQKNNTSGVNFKFKLQIQKLKLKNERLKNAYSKKQGNAEPDLLKRIIPCVIKCKVGSIIEHKGAIHWLPI